jgi:hypothetical protein
MNKKEKKVEVPECEALNCPTIGTIYSAIHEWSMQNTILTHYRRASYVVVVGWIISLYFLFSYLQYFTPLFHRDAMFCFTFMTWTFRLLLFMQM